MTHLRHSLLVASLVLVSAGFSRAADGNVEIAECLISLINDVEIPAPEAGRLIALEPHEGDSVELDSVLGRIEDAQVKFQRDVAQFEYQVAEQEAKTDINVRYARAKFGVATAIYDGVKDANRRATQSVPQAIVQQRRLEMREAELSIEKAEHDMRVASLTAQGKRAALDVAEEQVNRRQIKSPITGLVVETLHEAGEWVQAGEPVLRVIRMDQLRVEGVVSARDFSSAEIEGRPVTVMVELAGGQAVEVKGKITFANPIVDTRGEYKVWAEVPNSRNGGRWMLQPGLTARMTIHVQPVAQAATDSAVR